MSNVFFKSCLGEGKKWRRTSDSSWSWEENGSRTLPFWPRRHGKGHEGIASVAWILLVGDAIHNFVDGLSIGTAFTENVFTGISVSLAVICEELPHELGTLYNLKIYMSYQKGSTLYKSRIAYTNDFNYFLTMITRSGCLE